MADCGKIKSALLPIIVSISMHMSNRANSKALHSRVTLKVYQFLKTESL